MFFQIAFQFVVIENLHPTSLPYPNAYSKVERPETSSIKGSLVTIKF